jgi:capsular exopolysaccharide synthesis family protein
MSKYFNDVQNADLWARKLTARAELDQDEVIEAVKKSVSSGPLIAESRLGEARRIHIGNGNGTPLVSCPDQSAKVALEAYRGLRTRLIRAQSSSGLRTIAITSSQPGEGKTLTVMNLGICYSQLPDQSVLLIDADLRTRGLSSLLGQTHIAGLSEILGGQATAADAVLATDQKNLFVLPAGSIPFSPPELFSSPRWIDFLGWCNETFKIVLIDTPPIVPLADFELINAACDGVVLVARARQTPRETLKKSVSSLDSKRLLGIVLNATEVGPKNHYGYS